MPEDVIEPSAVFELDVALVDHHLICGVVHVPLSEIALR